MERISRDNSEPGNFCHNYCHFFTVVTEITHFRLKERCRNAKVEPLCQKNTLHQSGPSRHQQVMCIQSNIVHEIHKFIILAFIIVTMAMATQMQIKLQTSLKDNFVFTANVPMIHDSNIKYQKYPKYHIKDVPCYLSQWSGDAPLKNY